MDYRVHKVPHEVWWPTDKPGEPGSVLVATSYDLIREPHGMDTDPAYFGTVSEEYQVFDNVDLGIMLDPLSKLWPVETCGGIGAGKQMFLTFKTGKYQIAGDEMDGFFMLTEGKDGRRGTSLHQTDVRMVCMNTFRLATSRSHMNVAIPHTGGARAAVEFWSETLPQLQEAQAQTRAQLAALAERKYTAAELDSLLMKAYPDPPRRNKARLHQTPGYEALPEGRQQEIVSAYNEVEYYTARQGKFRTTARALVELFNEQHPKSAGTLWAAANAVVECEDYRRGSGDDSGSALFGDRANTKKRAFSAAFDIAGIK